MKLYTCPKHRTLFAFGDHEDGSKMTCPLELRYPPWHCKEKLVPAEYVDGKLEPQTLFSR